MTLPDPHPPVGLDPPDELAAARRRDEDDQLRAARVRRFERARVEELCDATLETERRLALRLLRLIYADPSG